MIEPFLYDPPQCPIEIIHIDSSIIILNKPAGLLTVPGKIDTHNDCLLTRVRKEIFGALLVHRLDLDTSGLIIFARTASSQVFLNQQFEKRKIKKTYTARVNGHLNKDQGKIDLPIIVDWPKRPMQKVCLERGRKSITAYTVLKREKKNITRLRLYPITGRTHQLRLHMKSIGHPILGDRLYGDKCSIEASHRLELHSTTLEVIHPKTQKTQIFSSIVPF